MNSLHDGILTFFSERQTDFSFPPDRAVLLDQHKENLYSQLPYVPRQIITIKQVHGTDIVQVDDSFLIHADRVCEADGLVTDVPGIALTIRTADCLPIFLFDPIRRCIGLVHAGWRGTHGGIVSKVIEFMKEQYGCDPYGIRVMFGPAIRSCCYAVGPEFAAIFPGHVLHRAEKSFLDLPAVNRSQLLFSGVPRENIEDRLHCTCCSPDFFSYRREGKAAGRHLSLIALTGC